MVKLGFIPEIPSSEDVFNLSTATKSGTEELSKACHSSVIEMLMSYFQINYFKNNMMDATAAKAYVIPVKAKITMPCFHLVPDSDLQQVTKLKQSLSLLLQKAAFTSSQFISELLVLKSACLLQDELSNVVKKTELKSKVQFHFEIHYHKARMEFIREFNIKNIDWENFESKVIHTQPFWRQRDLPMPEAVINRYANKIKNRIQTSKERFDPESVTAEFQQFLLDGEAAVELVKRKKSNAAVEKSTGITHPPGTSTSSSSNEQATETIQPNFQFCVSTVTAKNTLSTGKQHNKKFQQQSKGQQKNESSSNRRHHNQNNNDKKLHPRHQHNRKTSSSLEKQPHEDFTSILQKTK